MILAGIEQSKFDSFSAILEHISASEGGELIFARVDDDMVQVQSDEDEPIDNKQDNNKQNK